MLPQLPRPKLRIHEPLDQRSIRPLLRQVARARTRRSLARKRLLHKVLHRRRQAQPLDPLRAPLRRDLIARRPPHLLRIALEERQVQLAPKAVDQKILKALLRLDLAHPRLHSSSPRAPSAPRQGSSASFAVSVIGIVEELPQIIDPALSAAGSASPDRDRPAPAPPPSRLHFRVNSSSFASALAVGRIVRMMQRPQPAQRRLLRADAPAPPPPASCPGS
jgi:hypothetical protein